MIRLGAILFGIGWFVAGVAAGVALMARFVHTVGDAEAIISTGFTAVAIATAAALIAFWAALDSGRIAKQRTTLEHIAMAEADSDMLEANRTFIRCRKEPEGLVKYAEANFDQTEEGQAIRIILNDFELIAIGIELGIMDYELFKRWSRSNVLFYWKKAHPYIARIRERLERPLLWHEFEQMAQWMDDNKPPKRRFSWNGS